MAAPARRFNHDVIDKLSREGDEARRKLKVIREEHEKVEKMNLEVKQSIDAMARKLSSVTIETPGGIVSGSAGKDFDSKEASNVSASGDDNGVAATIKQIALIEERMTQLMEVLDAGGDAAGDRSGDAGAAGAVSDLQNMMETLLSKNKFNVRVRPITPTSKEHLLLRGAGLSAIHGCRVGRKTRRKARRGHAVACGPDEDQGHQLSHEKDARGLSFTAALGVHQTIQIIIIFHLHGLMFLACQARLLLYS